LVGSGVSDGWAVGVGVKVLVKTGRSVLVGVDVISDRRTPPTEQPSNISTSKVPRATNNKTRFFIKQQSSKNHSGMPWLKHTQ
jgi:hypothetical protein